MRSLATIGAIGTLVLSALSSAPRHAPGILPKVASASVPFYASLAPSARIQGVVTLRVLTDGTRVSAIDRESGPPMLVRAAKENIKTWQFEPHTPSRFEVTFHYKLLQYECDSECRCDGARKEYVMLQLPINVEVSAKIPMICDPAVPTSNDNRQKKE